ncbi:hypothetical protein H2200_009720 [Cladophialophora chaetospira]|uniref:Ankyrin repeat protein n=1 Tax=Cladophialophora chaetospira TaxID=386627 RepID=A0AA39CF17_9EURO|nr:hypothetical protein H2200_009720 [Cladophialophora chaetospira]
MAELQTAGAAISLAFHVAALAHKAVKLIKRVLQADVEAEALQHRTEHLESLAKSVGKVLRYRKKQRGDAQPPPAEKDIIKTIKGSLVECRTCLKVICDRLKPYAEQKERGTLDKMSTGFKFVNSQAFIESQEKIISSHLQNLTLLVTLLNNLDHIDDTRQRQEQGRYLREVRTLVEAVVRQVVDEQSSVFRLLEADASEHQGSPSPEDMDDIESDPESDGGSSKIEMERRCPECWKRNLPVPDTPLAIAVKREQSEIVRGILETCEDKDIMITDAEDWTLLHYAAHKADHATVCVLLESSVGWAPDFIDARSKDGQTALMQIAKQADQEKSLELAKELIAHKCNLDAEDDSSIRRSALYFAIDGPKTTNRERFVDYLVERGAQKATLSEKYPEKASDYLALREQSHGREQKESSSSIGRKLSKAFSRSE